MKKILALLLCLLVLISFAGAQADLRMPASLTIIGEEAFAGDSSISGLVEVPGRVARIDDGAFKDTNLTALDIPSSVAYVGSSIVSGSPVTYVAVVNDSAELADSALNGAAMIISREGSTAHQWAEANEVAWYDMDRVNNYDGFLYYQRGDGACVLLCAADTNSVSGSVKVPTSISGSTVAGVSEYAFTRCSRLQSVELPNSVGELPAGIAWPELNITYYNTVVDPVMPEGETVSLKMDESHLILPTDWSEWIWASSFDEIISMLDESGENYCFMWYSTDDSIVSVSQDGKFTTHALGNAAITAMIRTDDTIYTGVVQINVVEPEVTLEEALEDSTVIRVGETNLISIRVNTNLSRTAPIRYSMTFSSSDAGIFTSEQRGVASTYITGVAPGEATLHVSALCGGQVYTLDLPVTVSETGYALNISRFFNAYTGVEHQLSLIGELPEGAACSWFSEDDEIATVSEDGVLVVNIEKERVNVGCEITYADGSTEQVVSSVYGLDANPYIEFYENPMRFHEGQSGSIEDMPFLFDFMWYSNDYYNLPEFVYEFSDYDESVITFEDGKFYALEEGITDVHVKASSGDIFAEADFTVDVYAPWYDVHMQADPIHLDINWTDFHLDYHFDSEIGISSYSFTSSNTKVVKVAADGLLLPVAEGDAVITLTVVAPNGHEEVRTVDVHVRGSSFAMDVEEITLEVGESYTLVSMPDIPDGYTMFDDYFESKDESIAYADDSTVYAVSAGSAYVWHEVNIRNDETGEESVLYAKTLVNVVDPDYPIQLNATALTLGRYETFPLKATFTGEAANIRWYSEDEDNISVEGDGENAVVTLYDAWRTDNYTKIWCVAEIGGEEYSACCLVSFEPFRAQIEWFPDQLDLGVGDSSEIDFIVFIADPELEVEYQWSTGDPSIAEFTEPGVLTGVSSGVTTYTLTAVDAADGSFVYQSSGKVFVSVPADEPTDLYFDRNGYLLTLPGGRLEGDHAHAVIEAEYNWDRGLLNYSSDNENIVRIDDDGNLEPVGVGMTRINVTMPMFGLSASAPVVVMENCELAVIADYDESTEDENDRIAMVGDEILVGLPNIPAEALEYFNLDIHYDQNPFHFMQDEGEYLRLQVVRRDGGDINADLYVFDEHITSFDNVRVNTVSPEPHLNEGVMYLTVGDEHDLCPEFDRNPETDAWASTNDSVAVYDEEHGRVVAVGAGECTIGYHGYDHDGKEITASCLIYVAETCEWTLNGMHVPDVMVLGRSYGLYEYVETTNWIGPDVEFTSSNPDVVSVNIKDDRFDAVAVGTTEITCIATKHGETQTVTKTVRVIEPALQFEYYHLTELRPGQTKEVKVVAREGLEIESVSWRSNASAVSVTPSGLDTADIKAEKGSGMAIIYATATFTDGSTATVSLYTSVVRDEDVWFDGENIQLDSDSVELSLNEVNHLAEMKFGVNFYTNAALDDLTIEWSTENSEVVEITALDPTVMDNGDGRTAWVNIKGLSVGEDNLKLHIYSNDLGIDVERGIPIRVFNPEFTIFNAKTDYTVLAGSSCALEYEEDATDGFGAIGPYVVTSSNPEVVTAQCHNEFKAHKPGDAVLTYKVYHYNEVIAEQEFYVHVVGAELNETSLDLNEGDTFQLVPSISYMEHFNGYEWSTSDPGVVTVSNDGFIAAVGAGKATVSYHAHGSNGETYAHCEVTVTGDEPSGFYLTESFIELPSDQEHELYFVSELGTPSSVEWEVVNGYAEIAGQDNAKGYGVVRAHGVGEYHYTLVTCTAVINGQTYTDSCTVKVIPPVLNIWGFEGCMDMYIGQQEYVDPRFHAGYDITDVTISMTTDDPNVADWGQWEDGNRYIEAKGAGVTQVHYTVTAGGHNYTASMTIFVETDRPEIEKVECEVGTLLLYPPEDGPINSRYIPLNFYPEHAGCTVKYSSENPDVADVNEEGYAWGTASGETVIHITFPDNPELESIDLPVYVTENGSVAFNVAQQPVNVGEEYTVTVGSLIENEDGSTTFVEWPTDAYDLYCESSWGHEEYRFYDEDTFYAARPGEYDFHAWIDMRHGFQLEDHCHFTVQAEDEYIINWHPDSEALVHPQQHVWPDYRTNFDDRPYHIEVSSDTPDVLAVLDSENNVVETGDHWIALKEGKATVQYWAVFEDGSTTSKVTQVFTVKEPEAPVMDIDVERVIRVGETLPVYVGTVNHYYNGADWHEIVSSDPEVLSYDGWNNDWGSHLVTAHKAGTVTLSVTGWYGELEGSATVTVTVVDEAPVYVSSEGFELRRGDTKQLYLRSNVYSEEEYSVEWVSSNPEVISVDEDGNVTAHAAEGRVAILGYVSFNDGSQYTTHTNVNITQDWELWLDFHGRPDNMTLGLNPNFGPASDQWAHAYFSTTWGGNELSVEWVIETEDDQEVVRIGTEEGDEKFFFNNENSHYNTYEAHVHLYAVNTGNATVYAIIKANGNEIERRSFGVEVINPYFEIVTEESEVTIGVNERRGLSYGWDSSWDFGQFSYHTLKSNDESVVVVNVGSELLGVAPGTATVTVAAYADNDQLMDTQEFTVNVVADVTLNETELVLAKGETFTLIPNLAEGLEEDENFRFGSWYSDDNSVATITNDGTVIGVSVGVTHVYYEYYYGENRLEARCVVTVPDSHEDFKLSRDTFTMGPSHSYTLEVVNNRGVNPDNIEWFTNYDCLGVEPSEDGTSCVVYSMQDDHFDHTQDAVYCRATFGDETVYAICRVKTKPAALYIDHIDTVHTISAGEERYIPVGYRVAGEIEHTVSDTDFWIDLESDNPSIAELIKYDDDHIHLRAYQQGTTDVHVVLHAAEGSSYCRTMTVYVDEQPALESFELLETPMVLDDPEHGISTTRWIPYVCEPDFPYDIRFTIVDDESTDEDDGIITFTEEGQVQALRSGRAIVHAEVVDYPHLSRDFFVLVIGDFGFVGPEDNTMQSGEEAQLSIDGDYWNAYDLNVSFGTEAEWHQISVTEDGFITAREPGDYIIYAFIGMHDGALVREYPISVVRGDEYFYINDPSFVMYEGQHCGVGRTSSYYNVGEEPGILFESDNPDIVLGSTEHADLSAVAAGTANVKVTLFHEDGSSVESSNSMNVTVLPAEVLPFWMTSARVVKVGETIDVWIDAECESNHMPYNYYCESDNESVLTVTDGNKITGVSAGQATLTIHAEYGEIHNEIQATIYVIE